MPHATEKRPARSLVVLSVASLALAGVGAWAALQKPDVAASQADTSEVADGAQRDELVEALRQRIARLERTSRSERTDDAALAALRRELAEHDARIAELTSSKPSDADAPPEPSIAQAMQRERAHTEQLVGFLDRKLSDEGRDAAWAPGTEAAVTESLRAELGAAPRSVTCGSTMCKVEMVHTDIASERQFIHKLVHVRALGDTEAFSSRDERDDGTVATLTFVARAGGRLPEPS